MIGPKPPIFEEIGEEVIQRLNRDELFSEDLVQQIAELFESGGIEDQAKVLEVLQGESSENSQPGN